MTTDLLTEFSKRPGRLMDLHSRKRVERDRKLEYFDQGIWEELSTDGEEGRLNTPQGKEKGVKHVPRKQFLGFSAKNLVQKILGIKIKTLACHHHAKGDQEEGKDTAFYNYNEIRVKSRLFRSWMSALIQLLSNLRT